MRKTTSRRCPCPMCADARAKIGPLLRASKLVPRSNVDLLSEVAAHLMAGLRSLFIEINGRYDNEYGIDLSDVRGWGEVAGAVTMMPIVEADLVARVLPLAEVLLVRAKQDTGRAPN